MTTLYEDELLGLDSGEAAFHSGSGIVQPPSSGIGLSAPSTASPQPPSTGTRILRAIEGFGSGLARTPDPNIRREESARKKKQQQLDELKGTVSALEHGVSMVQGMEGQERESFIKAYAGRLDKIDAGLGETYRKLADRPDLLTKYKDYLPELPEHLQIMARTDPKAFLKFVGTAEGVKAMGEGLDRRELRTATKKIQTVMMGYQQLVPPEVAKGIAKDGVITASEILSLQEYLPEKLRLSDGQLQAMQRSDKTFWNGLGVLHGEKEQEVLAKRAKGGEPQSDLGRLKADLKAGHISQEEYDAKAKKLTTHQPSVNVYSAGLTEAVDEDGNRVFIQPSPQEGVPPRVIKNVKPPPKAGEEKAARDREQSESTVASVRSRIESLTQALQKESHLVGPAGAVRRGVEVAHGVVNPGAATPALDYKNEVSLLVADVRKIVEKDPNLSNEERRNLYETLGSGTFQTTGSAVRALSNVLGYVEGKTISPSRGAEPSQADLEHTAKKHGITVEEVKRRLKAKKK